jgi:hypothetical protein
MKRIFIILLYLLVFFNISTFSKAIEQGNPYENIYMKTSTTATTKQIVEYAPPGTVYTYTTLAWVFTMNLAGSEKFIVYPKGGYENLPAKTGYVEMEEYSFDYYNPNNLDDINTIIGQFRYKYPNDKKAIDRIISTYPAYLYGDSVMTYCVKGVPKGHIYNKTKESNRDWTYDSGCYTTYSGISSLSFWSQSTRTALATNFKKKFTFPALPVNPDAKIGVDSIYPFSKEVKTDGTIDYAPVIDTTSTTRLRPEIMVFDGKESDVCSLGQATKKFLWKLWKKATNENINILNNQSSGFCLAPSAINDPVKSEKYTAKLDLSFTYKYPLTNETFTFTDLDPCQRDTTVSTVTSTLSPLTAYYDLAKNQTTLSLNISSTAESIGSTSSIASWEVWAKLDRPSPNDLARQVTTSNGLNVTGSTTFNIPGKIDGVKMITNTKVNYNVTNPFKTGNIPKYAFERRYTNINILTQTPPPTITPTPTPTPTATDAITSPPTTTPTPVPTAPPPTAVVHLAPVANIICGLNTIAGVDTFISGAGSYSPNGLAITKYFWTIDGADTILTPSIGGNVKFNVVGTYTIKLFVQDELLANSPIITKQITVTSPMPKAVLTISGNQTQKRMVKFDASTSYAIGNSALDWSKATLEFSNAEGVTTNIAHITSLKSIYVPSGDYYTGPVLIPGQKDYFIFFDVGTAYSVKLTMYNLLGKSDSATYKFNIAEDLPPVTSFRLHSSLIYREYKDLDIAKTAMQDQLSQAGTGYYVEPSSATVASPYYAVQIVYDGSYSPDGDVIDRREWFCTYDANNNSSFDDDIKTKLSLVDINGNAVTNATTVVYFFKDVGKRKFNLTSYEAKITYSFF